MNRSPTRSWIWRFWVLILPSPSDPCDLGPVARSLSRNDAMVKEAELLGIPFPKVTHHVGTLFSETCSLAPWRIGPEEQTKQVFFIVVAFHPPPKEQNHSGSESEMPCEQEVYLKLILIMTTIKELFLGTIVPSPVRDPVKDLLPHPLQDYFLPCQERWVSYTFQVDCWKTRMPCHTDGLSELSLGWRLPEVTSENNWLADFLCWVFLLFFIIYHFLSYHE